MYYVRLSQIHLLQEIENSLEGFGIFAALDDEDDELLEDEDDFLNTF